MVIGRLRTMLVLVTMVLMMLASVALRSTSEEVEVGAVGESDNTITADQTPDEEDVGVESDIVHADQAHTVINATSSTNADETKAGQLCCCKAKADVQPKTDLCTINGARPEFQDLGLLWPLRTKAGYTGAERREVVPSPVCVAWNGEVPSDDENEAQEKCYVTRQSCDAGTGKYCHHPTENWRETFITRASEAFFDEVREKDKQPMRHEFRNTPLCDEFEDTGLFFVDDERKCQRYTNYDGVRDIAGCHGKSEGDDCRWKFYKAFCFPGLEFDTTKGICLGEEHGVHKALSISAFGRVDTCPAGYTSSGCTCDSDCISISISM